MLICCSYANIAQTLMLINSKQQFCQLCTMSQHQTRAISLLLEVEPPNFQPMFLSICGMRICKISFSGHVSEAGTDCRSGTRATCRASFEVKMLGNCQKKIRILLKIKNILINLRTMFSLCGPADC